MTGLPAVAWYLIAGVVAMLGLRAWYGSRQDLKRARAEMASMQALLGSQQGGGWGAGRFALGALIAACALLTAAFLIPDAGLAGIALWIDDRGLGLALAVMAFGWVVHLTHRWRRLGRAIVATAGISFVGLLFLPIPAVLLPHLIGGRTGIMLYLAR